MCDTLVSLTDDGVLFAKNSDRDPNEAQVLSWHPAADHRAGDTVTCTWITIAQVARTNAVVLSRPWWMWGAEMGANEHGVVIGNEAVFTTTSTGPTALLGMDLLRLALERADTAPDAVSVIVDLLERHGQGGSCSHEHPGLDYHNSFLVADACGAIVLETAGRQWATETVAGRGRSISNGLTIEGFAAANTQRIRPRVAESVARRTCTQRSADTANGPGDLFTALRNHGRAPSPTYSMVNGALSAPCVHAGGRVTSTQSTASWVADLRSTPLHWVTATSAPCTSLFKPVRVDDPTPRPGDDHATNRFDDAVGWWRHEQIHRLALRDHAASIARFAPARDRIERTWLDAPPSTESAFVESDRFDREWLADLVAADLPDRRPRWLRSLWAGWNDAAAVPVPERATEAATT